MFKRFGRCHIPGTFCVDPEAELRKTEQVKLKKGKQELATGEPCMQTNPKRKQTGKNKKIMSIKDQKLAGMIWQRTSVCVWLYLILCGADEGQV